MEFKLRYLVQDDDSTCRVFAVFDCCRVKLGNYEGLAAQARGKEAAAGYSDIDSE